jgi:hypothetical protein
MDLSTGKPYGAAAWNWSPLAALATFAVIVVLAMALGFVATAQRGPGAGSDTGPIGGANPNAGLVEVRIPSSIAAPPGSAAANSPRFRRDERGQ